jgi:kumamolisin
MLATVRLAGSARPDQDAALDGTTRPLTSAELAAPAAVTLHLRESRATDSIAVRLARQHLVTGSRRRFLDASTLAALHGADPADVDAVRRWADGAGLQVHQREGASRSLEVTGSLAILSRAFSVAIERHHRRDPLSGEVMAFRDHREELSIPADLDGVIVAALGLSDRPLARPRLAAVPRGEAPAHSYTAEELAALYNFPMLPDGGRGRTFTVGIAELGGAVHRPDLARFTAANPRLRVVEECVQGWGPIPDPFGADTEVALDWQVVASAVRHSAPHADIVIVIKYAPNTDRGFTNLEESFASDGRDYLSVSTSWGAPESNWTPAAMDVMDRAFQLCAARGIVHTVAAGDNGSRDGVSDGRQHVDHPASAPHAIGCGGTTLVAERGQRISEVVWNELGATGGGVSDHFGVPRYQAVAGVRPVSVSTGRSGRGVPDVAANADPSTGYLIHHRGEETVVGGTSAVAPLWAALLALIGDAGGHGLGDALPGLYAARRDGFLDVTAGGNGAYAAARGWDATTGLGVPDGVRLGESLRRALVMSRERRGAAATIEVG